MTSRNWTFLLGLILPVLFSCTNVRKAIYFDIDKDLETKIQDVNNEAIIQKNDLLGITVTSLSPEASALYNPPVVIAGTGASAVPGGYLVNEEGNIQFPVIGTVKAVGLTKRQLQEQLTKALLDRKQLLDPVVSIRIINYRITVLGEVSRPTVVNVPSEKINMLEAIGYAGDLTLFADRSNVLLIREENGLRNFKILNLNSTEIFTSPYFYLKPNDVVYVRPNKTRISSASPTRQWLPVILSVLTFGVIVVDRLTN